MALQLDEPTWHIGVEDVETESDVSSASTHRLPFVASFSESLSSAPLTAFPSDEQTGHGLDACVASHPHEHPEILEREWKRVYGQAYSLTRNPADAEDAVQETYLRLFQAGARGGRIESTTAWMRGVLRNVVFQTFQRLRPDLHIPLDSSVNKGENEVTLADTLVEARESVEERLIEVALVARALRAISELPEMERECVLMYARGYSFVQIQNALEITYKVALTKTKKALAKVRSEIAR